MIVLSLVCLLAASACDCMDENMLSIASGRLAILHLLLVLLESQQQRHWKPCEPRAHWDSGGTNRDGTRSWSLGKKPNDPWRLAQTSSPQCLRRRYSHAFAPLVGYLRGLGSRAPFVAVCAR